MGWHWNRATHSNRSMENTDMAISKKLEIIYHNGQPDGIRSIRRHLSTMTTYVIPRPLLSEAKKLTGINRPGIYYLISENDDNKQKQYDCHP